MGKRDMRKRSRPGRRLLGIAALLAAVLLLEPGAPASAVPERDPEEALPAVELLPAESRQAAEEVPAEEAAPVERASELEQAPAEEAWSGPVPEGPAVEDSYFDDTVFLGDSRTEGFHLYSGLEEGAYLYAVGATVESVFTKATQETGGGKVPMLDALAELECGKVYIMLGANELGWPRSEAFHDQYGKVIDRIREDHPDAEVVIQSILPVSAVQEAKGSYVNNSRIQTYNAILEELALEKECPYLNVSEAVTGEDGCLRPELTTDGIHLNTAGCKEWLNYLKTHAVS